jgi:Icc protein
MKQIAHLTDLHLDDSTAAAHGIDTRSNLIQVLTDVRNKGIRDVVLTGDLGERQTIGWLQDQLRIFGLSSHYVLGNHDDLPDYEKLPMVFRKMDSFKYIWTPASGKSAPIK